jgi:hypothetical protein
MRTVTLSDDPENYPIYMPNPYTKMKMPRGVETLALYHLICR